MGAAELSDVVVQAVDAHNYIIDFGDASSGLPQPLLTASNYAGNIGGFLPAIDVSMVRQAGTTIAVPVSASDPVGTAANIEYAFSLATSQDNVIGPITFPYAEDVTVDDGSPVGPYYTPDILRTGLPTVKVTAQSATEFDIMFTGNVGKLQQPLMQVMDPSTYNASTKTYEPLDGATVTIIKQSSDAFRVNALEPDDPTTLRIDVYDQINPQVAMDVDGDFVITWQSVVPDSKNPGSVSDIFARRFSPAGYNQDWDTIVDTVGVGGLPSSAFVADMNLANHLGTPDALIQGVRPLGSQFQVNTTTANPQLEPSVGMDGDGNFTIAWVTRGQSLSFFNTVSAQRYDRDGNRLGGEFIVNTVDPRTTDFAPFVAMSNDGVLAIAWSESNDPDFILSYEYGSTATSYFKVYDADGALLVPEQNVNGWIPTVDFDAADNFVVTYEYASGGNDNYGDSNDNVYAQEFQLYTPSTKTLDFINIRTEFRINSATFTPDSVNNLWPLEQGAAQAALDADGDLTVSYGAWRNQYYDGYGPDVSEYVNTNVRSDVVAVLESMINDTTNADLLPYFDPAMGISYFNYFGNNGDIDGAISGILIQAQRLPPAITDEQLGRLRSILESVAGLLRGEANSAMFSQFDASIGTNTTSTILSSDDIANSHRDGQDASYFLAIDTTVISGSLTLSLSTPAPGTANTGNVVAFDGGVFDPDGTLELIHNQLSGLGITGGPNANWPQDGGDINNGPFQGSVAVRLLSEEEYSTRLKTLWDLTQVGMDANIAPYAIYEITFIGELHDTPVSLGVRQDRLRRADPAEGEEPSDAATSVIAAGMAGDPGTAQYDPSIAMTSSGSFVMVWNEDAQTSTGGISNTNIYFREFQESTDTAGPLATDFLLPSTSADQPNLRLQDGATVRQQMDCIIVSFDEDMMTAGANAVTNPNNWALMKNGVLVSGGIGQIYYGMNEGATQVGAAANNKWEAVIYLNGNGNSQAVAPYLLDGHYEIVATTGLRDKAGNAMGSSGYTLYGVSFSRSFDVAVPTGTETRVNDTTLNNQFADPSDEIQQITFAPTGATSLMGSFVLKIGNFTSSAIVFNSNNLTATAAAVQSKLYLAGYHDAVVEVVSNTAPYVLGVRFGGANAGVDQPAIAISAVTFAATVSVAETQKGQAVPPPQATASNANGDYVTVWTSDTAGSAGLYVKTYAANWTTTADGARQSNPVAGTEILVTALSGTRNYQGSTFAFVNASYASVASDAAGNFVVTWSEQDVIGGVLDWNIWAQRYTVGATVAAAGTAFMVNTTTADVQRYSAVAMDAVGNFVVTWQSMNQDGSGWGVYAQQFTASAALIGGQNETQFITFTGQPTGTFQLYWDSGAAGSHTTGAIFYSGSTTDTAAAIATQLQAIGASVQVTAVSATQIRVVFVGARQPR